MNFKITPQYKLFFNDEKLQLEDYLVDIPSSLIIKLVSAINAELYPENKLLQQQNKIFHFLIYRQPKEVKMHLEKCYAKFVNDNQGNITIFSAHLSLEFLHRSLIRENQPQQIEDTIIDQELRVFKALLIIAEEDANKFQVPFFTSNKMEFFYQSAWPSLLNQIGLNVPSNYMNEIIKAKCFFDHLQFESDYSDYVKRFLEVKQMPNTFTYIHNIIKATTIAIESKPNIFSPWFFRVEEAPLKEIFEELSIDIQKYAELYGSEKKHYLGIKDKPLYKIGEGIFCIIDINFFSKRIYNGLLYDFYKDSGISEVKNFKKFIHFKEYIGQNSIEKYLFKKLIHSFFSKKNVVIKFDDNSSQGFPDAYIRDRNKIFIFEIKDAYFNSSAIDSFESKKIFEEVDLKFNSSKKGTGQLIKHIQRLDYGLFEDKSYADLKLKKRNLEVYPILVYTDDNYEIPGIGNYLKDEFKKKLGPEAIGDFKHIHDLSFININFFIEFIDLFESGKFSLDKVINRFHKIMENRERKLKKDKTGDISLLSAMTPSFESIFQRLNEFDLKRDKYLETVFEKLNLRLGLESC